MFVTTARILWYCYTVQEIPAKNQCYYYSLHFQMAIYRNIIVPRPLSTLFGWFSLVHDISWKSVHKLLRYDDKQKQPKRGNNIQYIEVKILLNLVLGSFSVTQVMDM